MRDPSRIRPFAARIADGWSKMPEQRFGQLMLNFFHWLDTQNQDPFYMEDGELLKKYEEYISIFTDYRAPDIRA